MRFRDMTDSSGISFTPRNGQDAKHFAILETLGTGVAMFDYDGDEDLDAFFPGGGEYGENNSVRGLPSALFRQEGDWRFSRIANELAFPESLRSAGAPYYSHGAIVGDYDGDGFPDLLVTGYGGLTLYHNQGDGTFADVTRGAGLNDQLWSTAAAWGDLNEDGIVDLYVVHYIDWSFANHPVCPSLINGQRDVCAPTYFRALPPVFYAGNGNGTFRDATEEAGFTAEGKGLGVLLADLDLDGDLDVYVANDTTPNFLYRNEGRGRFVEIGLVSGTAVNDMGRPDGSMGVELADFDLNGLPDLWVTNFEDQSFALYQNLGHGNFQHTSRQMGITAVGGVYVGFGTICGDFDRDGDEDIFVANGHIRLRPKQDRLQQLPLLFENLIRPHIASTSRPFFVNVAPQAGQYLASPHLGRGVAAGDIDNDGDLDLAIAHTNEPVSVLSNESPSTSHWLKLRLIGTRSPRDAVGARVQIWTGSEMQARQVKGGGSYLSTSDPCLFFGLAESPTVSRMEIRWPSGIVQEFTAIGADQTLTIREPVEAPVIPAKAEIQRAALASHRLHAISTLDSRIRGNDGE